MNDKQGNARDSIWQSVKAVATLIGAIFVVLRALASLLSPPPKRDDARPAAPGATESTAAEPEDVESPERRRFLGLVAIGAGGAGVAAVSIPVVGFILVPVLKKADNVWRDVGAVADFRVRETVKVTFLDPSPVPWSGPAALSAAWLKRDDTDTFVAFKVNCTHLGCAVRWEPGPRFFMCPCHGGVFYEDGSVAAGPPLEPLHRYESRIRDGRVEIRTGPVPITGDLLEGGA